MTSENARPGVGTLPGPPAGDHPRDGELRVRRSARRQWLRRRDLERQLHDGAALRISALALRVGLLRHRTPGDEQEFRHSVERIQDELHLVLQELREVAGQLYPPLLDEAGLGAALREVAARSATPVRVDAPDERFGAAVEGAAYFAVLGCLPRMPGAPETGGVQVTVRRDGDSLVLLVTGVDPCHAASILDGVRALGGTVVVGETTPTTTASTESGPADSGPITVRIPCE